MKFRMVHNNFNVLDLAKSLKFYRDAFDMHEVRRIEAKDGSFIIVYLEDGNSSHQLELTWLRDRKEPYNLGDNDPTTTGSRSSRRSGDFSAVKSFFPRPVALMGLGAACISHSSLTFSRAQARSVIPLSPGLLSGPNAVSAVSGISTAPRPSRGHKSGQRRGRHFPRPLAFLRAQARSVIPLSPGLLTGPSAVSAASACERTGVERSPSGD